MRQEVCLALSNQLPVNATFVIVFFVFCYFLSFQKSSGRTLRRVTLKQGGGRRRSPPSGPGKHSSERDGEGTERPGGKQRCINHRASIGLFKSKTTVVLKAGAFHSSGGEKRLCTSPPCVRGKAQLGLRLFVGGLHLGPRLHHQAHARAPRGLVRYFLLL